MKRFLASIGCVLFVVGGIHAADITAVLDTTNGSSAFVVTDARTNAQLRADSDGAVSLAGPLSVETVTNVTRIEFAGEDVEIGIGTDGLLGGTAVGSEANARDDGAAVGRNANAYTTGAAIGREANAYGSGAAVGYTANGANGGAAVGDDADGNDDGATVGSQSDGSFRGAALGMNANGANTNVAIGFGATALGGSKRIAIGHHVTNQVNNSARLRGTLYLDGGTGVLVRSTFGSGAWTSLLAGLATGTPVYAETDPRWTSASNLYLSTNAAAAAYVKKSGDTMTGPLSVGNLTNVSDIEFSGANVTIGHAAWGGSDAVAVGSHASADVNGAGVGSGANANESAAVVGRDANGFDAGAVVGRDANAIHYGASVGYNTLGYNSGLAAGAYARGQESGVALGRGANGAQTNVAIGYGATAAGGSERIAIGHGVSNAVNDSAAIRGTLYLDGATGILARSTFGSGAWVPLLGTGAVDAAYVKKSGDTMTGTLTVNTNMILTGNEDRGLGGFLMLRIGGGEDIEIGASANGYGRGAAVGGQANAYYNGVAVGYMAVGISNSVAVGRNAAGVNNSVAVGMGATAKTNGVAVGHQANGNYNSAAVGSGAEGWHYAAAVGAFANAITNGVALGYSANGANEGAAMGRTANGSLEGVAAGYAANGSDGGVGIGYIARAGAGGVALGFRANGASANVAIGYSANSRSGTERVSIGHNVTNTIDNSTRLRGNLYLDGGVAIYTNNGFGSASWGVKAFTIPHPLDPENKVLRHFCLEGPDVWNVYAGNAQLMNGQAVVELPAYYGALNKAGSEIYSLTPIGRAQVWIESKAAENRFRIGGDKDVEVSWTIKVLRNDPACMEDLKRRPVEQLKSEAEPGRPDR